VPETAIETRPVAAPAAAVRARGVSPGWAIAATGFLVASLVVGVLAGPLHIGAGDAFRSLLAQIGLTDTTPLGATEEAILWDLRVPRVLLAALVGGMLALAGATYQGVFHNPLADPYLLGVAAGAGLGATLAISYLPRALAGHQLLPVAAFLGGAIAVVVTWALSHSAGRERDATTFVLAGVVVASFFTAVQTFVQQQNSDTLQEVYSWILGALPSSGWSDVAVLAPYVIVASAVILAYRRVLDVLSLGDVEAASLGVDVGRVRLLLVVAATIGTAAAVAVSGLIAFVGIIVPHTIRLVAGTSYRGLLPLSFIVGAGFLVLCDVIARTVLSPAELPIGVVTAFFGAPFFALALRSMRGRA
jgi:iron complex transport system permease protein